MLRKFIVSKIAVSRACREDQVIIGKRDTLTVRAAGKDQFLIFVHTNDFSEQYDCIPLPVQNFADGRRDLSGRQHGCGNLVEQRLEQVVIGAVDQNDLHG